MANVKNFGLIGVGSDVQFSKAGPRIINNAGTFNLKALNGTTDAALTTAGIVSSAGNVTLTTGDLVATTGNLTLSSNVATASIGDAGTIGRFATGVYQFSGTGALMLPVGITSEEPTGALGMVRANSTTSSLEYFNGTVWSTLATGGSTATLQAEIDAIETSLGAAISSSGIFVPTGFTNVTGVLVTPTDFTNAIQQVANAVNTDNNLNEIFPSSATGNVIYSNGSNVWAQAAPGATSGVQAYDLGLTNLAAKTSTGILVQTGADTYASVALVAPSRGFTITNADGVAGAPTFVLANNLAALEGNTTPGYYVITADGTSTSRTFAAVAGQLAITGDASGVTTNTTYGLATVTQAATGDFVKVTLDTFGRVTGNTAVTTADITTLVDSQYLRLDGSSTMAGSLNLGGNTITSVGSPVAATDAATKGYVDAAVSGLTWKNAVAVYPTTNINLTPVTAVIDGVTLSTGDRVLLTNQTDTSQNGIYVFNGAGVAMTRSTDAATPAQLQGAAVFIEEGTNANTGWVQTVDPLATFAAQSWSKFSGGAVYVGGVGIDISTNVISAKLGAGIAELPTGDIGVDLFNATTGALILTDNGTSRATDIGSQLFLLLDTTATGGLDQGAAGLFIKAGGVTNTQLVNSAIALDGDTGTGTVSLGGTINLDGTAAQGISTSVTGSTFTITAADATVLTKGVASFDTASFTVTAGAVTLNTVDVPHGGTGVTTFAAHEVLYGNGAGPIAQSANFTFDGTSVLAVGGALPISIDGAAGTISATATNGDLVLLPNGTGSVIVGPTGSGLIQSDAGQALTITGNTTLTLNSVTGTMTLGLPTGTGSKVTVSGPTAVDYATGLGASDLTNKQYVDDAIATGAAAGAVKALVATVDLSAAGATNVGAVMPAGATVLSVKVQVTSADTGTGTLVVGKTGTTAAYMTAAENDTQSTGLYMAEDYVVEAGPVQVIATVSAGAASGSANVIVEYKVAG